MMVSKLESPSHRSGSRDAWMPRATIVISFIAALMPMVGVGIESADSPARPSPTTPTSAWFVSTGTAGSSPLRPSILRSASTRTTAPSSISTTRKALIASRHPAALDETIGGTPYTQRSAGAPGASATSVQFRTRSPSALRRTHSTRACTGAVSPLVRRTSMPVGSPGRTWAPTPIDTTCTSTSAAATACTSSVVATAIRRSTAAARVTWPAPRTPPASPHGCGCRS